MRKIKHCLSFPQWYLNQFSTYMNSHCNNWQVFDTICMVEKVHLLTTAFIQEKRTAKKRGNRAMTKYRITRTDGLPDFLPDGYSLQITIECGSASIPLQDDIDNGKEKTADFGGFPFELRPHDRIEIID